MARARKRPPREESPLPASDRWQWRGGGSAHLTLADGQGMTEAKWLRSADPRRMLDYVWPRGGAATAGTAAPGFQRRLTLYCAAVCRAYFPDWDHAPAVMRETVAVHERYADGKASKSEIVEAGPVQDPPTPAPVRAALLREIFGNPFRPVVWDRSADAAFGMECNEAFADCRHPFVALSGGTLRWNDGAAPKIAQSIYNGRRFEDMPVLADALLDAGCENEVILAHCRGMGRCSCGGRHLFGKGRSHAACGGSGWIPLGAGHARGCWVIDLILGKT